MSITDENTIFAPGVNPGVTGAQESPVKQQDYFGFETSAKFYFPDGVSWIEFKPMNEGAKKSFQDKTSRDLVVERNSGNARMSVLQGSERHTLIIDSVTNWNLVRNGVAVPFSKSAFSDFLTLANPVLIEDLEKAIRKANPWLLADMKSEDIEKEIANLQEMLESARKREAGEAS